ncbi:glucan biosynthesis protein G [Alteromonas macleodii str. 'Black Sea 11']|uniref:glucan biosynthesis protein n=1 Tax=Alteromonas abrolhosensis TaxID=1892904 RepID=UPI000286E39E|nr:glucan biosynthesis protein G [Alteromonas macleodii str. 'Black Sea 11']NKX04478.1 glucan biosynthesis protein G [Alteromonadaceae bacterium A_SAG6]NKX17602.1 glucan biosynthesis protein G [Alteromonadaceae bacterium A_SAG5]NKX34319.1 glucan biosynthesis protein G [Alteromonadaceae bacterium A_SAG3]NKX68967.1 glucan biosynthesis protein G [Alteromonadaceae bacterium A_SAG7]
MAKPVSIFGKESQATAIQHRKPMLSRVFIAISSIIALVTFQHAVATEVNDTNQPQKASPVLQSIIDAARTSATESYEQDDHGLNSKLKEIDYTTYRSIRFKPEQSLWHGENDYELQFFHPGFLYEYPVTIHTIGESNKPERLAFNSDMFNYDGSASGLAGLTDEKSGFAGFRVHYPIKNEEYKDEFAVFLGASYFRLVGKNQVYGISARGLAIDTALAKGEEFPHFTEFWIIEPSKGKPITIYARLESPSVAGAYKFVIQPDVDTSVKVESWLFARDDVNKLGIAPFTSMFLYGENTEKRHDDYRPEVHDSDGVLMVTHADEEIWRPLTNPARLQVTSLSDANPKGFGMLQRDGKWDNYLDAEANYHLRPGLWVTPEAGFEKGRLEVVEIPTKSEIHDNIVAFWTPEKPFKAGESLYFAYELKTVEQNPFVSELASVVRTRQGKAVLPGDEFKDDALSTTRQFSVDFSAPSDIAFDNESMKLVVQGTNGTISQQRLYPVADGQEWRATFFVKPKEKQTVDMRAYIEKDGKRVSEVWNYVYQPK